MREGEDRVEFGGVDMNAIYAMGPVDQTCDDTVMENASIVNTSHLTQTMVTVTNATTPMPSNVENETEDL